MEKIKVLVVDDSALVRQSLSRIIQESSNLELIATAADPYFAVAKMKEQKPDVITLDIQMPKMDGLTFLKKIMAQHPIPVVIISSIAKKDSDIALEAYRLGASEVIEKPNFTDNSIYNFWKTRFNDAIIAASKSNLSKIRTYKHLQIEKKVNTDFVPQHLPKKSDRLILMGSSAGGTEVINTILANLPVNTAPIAIVQHMPETFTKSYSERLDKNSLIKVSEANSGDKLNYGTAFIAPGNRHLLVKNKPNGLILALDDGEKLNRHKPSVDVLFESASYLSGKKIMAIILSGMGNDGANSMMKLKENGAITIAQNEETSIIYGMPREAFLSGAANYSLSIKEIIEKIKEFSVK